MRLCVEPQMDLDVLDIDVLRDRHVELVGKAVSTLPSLMSAVPIHAPSPVTASFAEVDCRRPALGQPNRGARIDQAEAVVVGEMQAAAVPVVGVVVESRGSPRPPLSAVAADVAAHVPRREARIVCTSRQPRLGLASSISATTPETIGAAADVPPKSSCVVGVEPRWRRRSRPRRCGRW